MPLATPQDYGKLIQAVYRPSKAGVCDLFVAPALTAYNATMGYNTFWTYAGRLDPDSYKNTFPRKYYDVRTGYPETVKESYVTDVDGSINLTLIEPTAKAFELANSGDLGVPIFQGAPVSTVLTASMTQADTLALTAVTGFVAANPGAGVEGSQIQVTTPAGVEYSYVQAINSLNIVVFPRLAGLAVTAATVKRVDGWEEPVGTSTTNTYALMIIKSLIGGGQLVDWIPKARAEGINDELPQSKIWKMPLKFTAFGINDGSGNYNGPVVAKKYILSSVVALSFY